MRAHLSKTNARMRPRATVMMRGRNPDFCLSDGFLLKFGKQLRSFHKSVKLEGHGARIVTRSASDMRGGIRLSRSAAIPLAVSEYAPICPRSNMQRLFGEQFVRESDFEIVLHEPAARAAFYRRGKARNCSLTAKLIQTKNICDFSGRMRLRIQRYNSLELPRIGGDLCVRHARNFLDVELGWRGCHAKAC